jgi:hypothetical protein
MALAPRLLRPRQVGGFDPRKISGLLAWYDAGDSATLFSDDAATSGVSADGQVAVWRDKSPNAHHLTQQTGASRPLYRTAIIGGQPALDFNGSSSNLATRDGSNNLAFPVDLAASKEISILCVSVADTTTGWRAFSFKRNNQADFLSGLVMPTDSANRFDATFGRGTGSSQSDYFQFLASSTATAWSIIAATFSNSGGYVFRYNRNAVSTSSPGSGSMATNLWLTGGSGNHNLCVGARGFAANNNLGAYMDGKIAELLIYTRALTSPEVQSLEQYLSSKYGVAV